MKTLGEILKEHPEWADIPVGIYSADGEVDMLGGSGDVYLQQCDEGEEYYDPIIMFSGN